jgi:hypothetical protein
MTRLPRQHAPIARILTTGDYHLGNNVNVNFDGSNSFAIAAWIRLSSGNSTGVLLRRGDEFVLGVERGEPYAKLARQGTPARAGYTLDTSWCYLVISYSATGPEKGTFQFFIDGAPMSETSVRDVGTHPTNLPLHLGDQLAVDVRTLTLYGYAFQPRDAQPRWQEPETPPPGVIASYRFDLVPPRETKANYPIQPEGDALQQVLTPAAYFSGASYATGDPADGVNPGGTGSDAYTIQTWALIATTNSPQPQVLFSNGFDTRGISLTVLPNTTTQMATLIAKRGSVEVKGGELALGTWHNFAVTYDGATTKLYVDKQLVASAAAGAIAPIAAAPIIGAMRTNGIPSLTGFVQGAVQSVDVWKRALTAEEIATHETTTPFEARDCTAVYDLAIVAANALTTRHVSLFGAAAISDSFVPPPSAAEYTKSAAEAPRPYTGPIDEVTPSPISEEQIAAALASLDELFPSAPAAARTAARAYLERTLREESARIEATGAPRPGTIGYALDGDSWVLYQTREDGADELLRIPVTEADECTIWLIEVVVAFFVGILGILAVPTIASRVAGAVVRWINRSRPVVEAAISYIGDRPTAATIVAAMRLILGQSSIVSLIGDILGALTWWDLFFTVAGVVVMVIEICFPNPSSVAWGLMVAAKLALVAVDLALLMRRRPPGCSTVQTAIAA